MKQISCLIIFAFVVGVAVSSCKTYSFTGTTIPPEIQTISIGFFENKAGQGPASLSQTFTDVLKDKFIQSTNLTIVKENGDLQFTGEIIGYAIQTQASSAENTDDFIKLQITVRVDYKNTTDEKDQWNQSFTKFELIASSEDLASIEETVITSISEQLAENIFNKALVKW